ncbi:hypothetical protein [Deinococcus sp. 23YEL01]|uniref:hypothetical protein n=1 Tax=Deinococcus sp. 23YEL01 TaxID=2745871 RepID=UPI001E2D56CD|nr:hypothetical protein [Deinococcus sp. 23YEL01]MCD0168037.1 hypothetical protein [Deinococcus sp. 23YEL01]
MNRMTGREYQVFFKPGSGQVIGSTAGATLRPSTTRITRVTYPEGGMFLDVPLSFGGVRFVRRFAVPGQDGRLHVRWWRTTGVWESE